MSVSLTRTSQNQNIPTKRMIITDMNQLPSDYSSTPGGTLYSTTPGGSRIVYDRTFLMNLRNSPMSQTPPKSGSIPDFLLRGGSGISPARSSPPRSCQTVEEEQFVMDL